MSGRKPRPIEIAPDDIPLLQQIAHSQTLPWYQVRRARILLGIAHGARTQILAFLTQCDESTVRRTCRRYVRLGLSGLLDSPTRSGRPIAISPPATCPDRRTGLLGARGRGPAHYPLDQRGRDSGVAIITCEACTWFTTAIPATRQGSRKSICGPVAGGGVPGSHRSMRPGSTRPRSSTTPSVTTT